MKYWLLLCFLGFTITGRAQDDVTITSEKGKIQVRVDENKQLHINVPPENVRKFKATGRVRYNDFGAKGDGKTDDMDAIAATHAFANIHGLTVKADDKATYYISGKKRTAIIKTDTDFGKASFIIDDTDVENRNASVFTISSGLKPFKPEGITSLKKNQAKLDQTFPATCLITVTNTNVKHYIRFGLNQNNGSSQTDIFVVDKNGNVDMNAPIIWDFDQITDITALPIDETPLKITGGIFTTIANQAPSKYTYYSRNISIRRSNVTVDGLVHKITGEGDHGAPYGGFIEAGNCSYVTVKNTVLTGHKTYSTIGAAGKPVSMGTYDISVNRALNVSFINCRQTNDITDATYWGIMGSNFSKNLLYDGCTFSRFDAHQGVANATVRNSTLGHMSINAIGSGTFTIENCTFLGRSIINLRPDYGSTWQGNLIIRNCVLKPASKKLSGISLITGSYTGMHDFGYVCYMPEHITIKNLEIDDSNIPKDYNGPAIFSDFNPKMKDESYQEKFPYVKTKAVTLEDVKTTSGKKLRVSDNTFMFKDVKVL
ncbi:hypothetical protein ACFOTA_18810 [Chitinophaga sp. GCM10012297]|uniref:Uncharacterized protein n=1 Tax=Chitinophaga chungangae TaxID=2821488 RepID=A0ABS3YHU6_9BACT|nr:hypothetical protein [Chitinophaga chungangae]MBO9154274.1 hypothetical protein [Chitinophaga chungangae]